MLLYHPALPGVGGFLDAERAAAKDSLFVAEQLPAECTALAAFARQSSQTQRFIVLSSSACLRVPKRLRPDCAEVAGGSSHGSYPNGADYPKGLCYGEFSILTVVLRGQPFGDLETLATSLYSC
ncbi:hypothetical protein ACP4OV_013160 [Aristida adscensionis]